MTFDAMSNSPRHSQVNTRKFGVESCDISLELTQIAAKYRCRSNNRTREISLKNRSTQNFPNYRRINANFGELCLHYFSTILYTLLCIDFLFYELTKHNLHVNH